MAKTKRPTQDQMAKLLNQPHFVQPGSTPIQNLSTDPILPTPMVLDVEQVRTYDRNPRRVPNSEYQAIYESIQANGLDQVLTITRRPGDGHYMVFAGGNTRLEIVQRLWRETGNAKYQKANVLFRPWSSDLETLLAHLRENDQRGDLTFIDRAYALVELRQMLEQELGLTAQNEAEAVDHSLEGDMQEMCQGGVPQWGSQKTALLSNQRFAETLTERGYSVQRRHLHLYWYSVEELADWIPSILNHGIGRPQIEEIHRIDKAFMDTWRFLKLEPEEEARQAFHALLQRMDAAGEVDSDQLWTLCTKELSIASDRPLNTCGMLMTEIAEQGTGKLDWFWKLDEESAGAAEQPAGMGQQDELTATPPLPSFQKPSGETIPAADFHQQTRVQAARPAPALPEAGPLDARARNFNLPLDEDEDPDEGGILDGLDDDLGNTLVAGPVGLPGHQAALAETGAQHRQGNSNYSFYVAETLQIPLPPMPRTLVELRQRMVALARELFRLALLPGELIFPIPSGVGFIVLPVSGAVSAIFKDQSRNDWFHALHVWHEMTEFSQQFMYPSPAHRFIPDTHRQSFPVFTQVMEQAEWDDRLFYDCQNDDFWKAYGQELPHLSGFHGREARAVRIFAHPAFGSVSLAYYMQLVETYRALHQAAHGQIWEDAQ